MVISTAVRPRILGVLRHDARHIHSLANGWLTYEALGSDLRCALRAAGGATPSVRTAGLRPPGQSATSPRQPEKYAVLSTGHEQRTNRTSRAPIDLARAGLRRRTSSWSRAGRRNPLPRASLH